MQDYELKKGDPLFSTAEEIVFYGLSGAPPTAAHSEILRTLAISFPKAIILLVPASSKSSKESVMCTRDYEYHCGRYRTDLRIALHKQMVTEVNNSIENKNIRYSLHEQQEREVLTYESIETIVGIVSEWLIEEETDRKIPIRMIWGADSVVDILTRRWSRAKDLCRLISEDKIKVAYIPRTADAGANTVAADTAIYFRSLLTGPVSSKKHYGDSDEDRTPFNDETLIDKIVANIENVIKFVPEEFVGNLSILEGVSSTKAREFIRNAWVTAKEEGEITSVIEAFNKAIMTAMLIDLPLTPGIREKLIGYYNPTGIKPPPYTSIECEGKVKTAGGRRKTRRKNTRRKRHFRRRSKSRIC